MTTLARVAVASASFGRRMLRIEEVGIPDPGPFQVSIKLFASGVCHSQLHQLRQPGPDPVILGHEATGVVTACGRAVTHVREGDEVMVTWLPRDPHRAREPESASLRLANDRIARSRNVFTWADHTMADEQFVVRLPSDAARDVTAIVGCAVMTGAGAVLHATSVQEGQSVGVFGVGGVGLCAVAAASVLKAYPIIALDIDDAKIRFARRLGQEQELFPATRGLYRLI